VVSFTHRPLYSQGKSPWYSLDRRLGGPQSRSGRGDEEKNSQPLVGLELPIIQHVTKRYTAELCRPYHCYAEGAKYDKQRKKYSSWYCFSDMILYEFLLSHINSENYIAVANKK
jgi:hypothetical protein